MEAIGATSPDLRCPFCPAIVAHRLMYCPKCHRLIEGLDGAPPVEPVALTGQDKRHLIVPYLPIPLFLLVWSIGFGTAMIRMNSLKALLALGMMLFAFGLLLWFIFVRVGILTNIRRDLLGGHSVTVLLRARHSPHRRAAVYEFEWVGKLQLTSGLTTLERGAEYRIVFAPATRTLLRAEMVAAVPTRWAPF